jgi:hypothetical protein
MIHCQQREHHPCPSRPAPYPESSSVSTASTRRWSSALAGMRSFAMRLVTPRQAPSASATASLASAAARTPSISQVAIPTTGLPAFSASAISDSVP